MGSIFRYRGISNNSLNALINDELYVSVPTQFNDPFDSCFTYDLENVTNAFLNNTFFLKNMYIYSYYQENRTKPSEDEISSAIREFGLQKNDIKSFLSQQCIKALKLLRDEFYIGCFSKNFDNTILWAHYADCGKGFVIEYDEKDIEAAVKNYFKKIHYNRQSFSIYDVVYDGNSISNDKLMIDILESFSDFLVSTISNPNVKRFRYEPTEEALKQIFLHKLSGWSYEKEKRIILPNTNLSRLFDSVGKIKPKAIYLGVNVIENNKYLIQKYCQENDILLFQMTIVFGEPNQKLDCTPIG